MHIIGTAGHVDHGKSSLVRALTGTDPDRWIEERLRGMTLDLGFAHLRFPDGVEAGIVDVPGHERFLHNMLAGAAGMEVLLLVIAANEGPRPQTIEHLAILDYLNVKRAIVVLTKIDLVDAEERQFAEELARETVAGTVAANAPVIGVSTLTGDGLDTLRDAIHTVLAALPPRAPDAPAFLPVDRVFARPGHGTVVTGTLMQGRIAVGDTLRLQPDGREVRVRGLQTFGEKRTAVAGGARVAVNIPGVDVAEIRRGAVLAGTAIEARSAFAVEVALRTPHARRRTPVRAYLGAAEILGTLVHEQSGDELRLRQPVAVYPGERFVLRGVTPKVLLGGGAIAGVLAGADDLVASPDERAVLDALDGFGLDPQPLATIAARANLREEAVRAALDTLAEADRLRRVAKPAAYLATAHAHAFIERANVVLREHHRAQPWSLGLTSIALARALGVTDQLLVRVLATAVERGELAYRAGYYGLPDVAPELTAEQRTFFDDAMRSDPALPNAPVEVKTVQQSMNAARITGLAVAYETLLGTGALVRIGEHVYRGDQLGRIVNEIERALRAQERMTAAQIRDVVGTSRKFVVPLLEWLDLTGVTVRAGDERVLRTVNARGAATPAHR